MCGAQICREQLSECGCRTVLFHIHEKLPVTPGERKRRGFIALDDYESKVNAAEG